jgi:hypothetical protein
MVANSSAIGFVASALVLAAFGMKDMANLRIVAICGNVALHRICTCLEPAAHIDTACPSLAAEWLAIGTGAAESKNSSTLLTDVCGSGSRPRIARTG